MFVTSLTRRGASCTLFNIARPIFLIMEELLKKYFRFRDLDARGERWDALSISRYHAKIEARLPGGARDLAVADWHYNANDPRCPHDSWLQSIDINYDESKTELSAV